MQVVVALGAVVGEQAGAAQPEDCRGIEHDEGPEGETDEVVAEPTGTPERELEPELELVVAQGGGGADRTNHGRAARPADPDAAVDQPEPEVGQAVIDPHHEAERFDQKQGDERDPQERVKAPPVVIRIKSQSPCG